MSEEVLELPAGIPAIGEVIAAKYRIERVLGVGGMGAVVAARHIRLDESVAIKILLPDLAKNAEVVERFMREARASVRIKNEHVGRVFDVETLENGTPYMVMECLQGNDLKEVLGKQGPLPPTSVVDYVLQACEALAEAHNLGIVHRDLKPSNLYLADKPDGTTIIKVLDFGIAKTAETADHSMTKTNAQMGTPFYMAPEQIQSTRDIDARADIWALGVVMFELLTDKLPFEGETLASIAVNVVIQPTPSVCAIRADVPPALDAAIARCLAKGRDERFPTIASLAEALAPLASPEGYASSQRILRGAARSQPSLPDIPVSGSAAALPIAPTKPAPPAIGAKTDGAWQQEPASKQGSRSKLWLGFAGAGLVTGAVVAAVVLLRGEPRATPEPAASVASAVVPAPEAADAGAAATQPTAIASVAETPEPAPAAPTTTSRKGRSRPSANPVQKTPSLTSPRPTKREPLPDIH